MKILAFESSCDETAVAVVEDGRRVLSDAIASQADMHALYGCLLYTSGTAAAAPLAGGAAGLRCAALFQLFLAAAVLPVGTVPSGTFLLAALWGLIVWIVTLFRRVRPAADWLLAPYLLWVSFTAYLNAGIWLLN